MFMKCAKTRVLSLSHVVLTVQWLAGCLTAGEGHKYWEKCLFLWQSFVVTHLMLSPLRGEAEHRIAVLMSKHLLFKPTNVERMAVWDHTCFERGGVRRTLRVWSTEVLHRNRVSESGSYRSVVCVPHGRVACRRRRHRTNKWGYRFSHHLKWLELGVGMRRW